MACDLVALHTRLTEKARSIIAAKNADYKGGGDTFANFNGSVVFDIHPIIGVLLRTQDKLMRLKSFVTNGTLQVKNESAEDAVLDVINYMVILKGLIEEMEAKK